MQFLWNLYYQHDNCNFAFWGQKCGFEQKQFHVSKLLVFYRNKSIGYRKQSLKIWAWSSNFPGFYRYFKFKIQRNKREWCKTFLTQKEYICHQVLLIDIFAMTAAISTKLDTCTHAYQLTSTQGSICLQTLLSSFCVIEWTVRLEFTWIRPAEHRRI